MNRRLALTGLLSFALLQHVTAQGPGANAVRSPELQPDRKVTFRLRAPNAKEVAVTGIQQYVKEVKEGAFPDDDHSYTVNEAEYEKFAAMVEKRRQV